MTDNKKPFDFNQDRIDTSLKEKSPYKPKKRMKREDPKKEEGPDFGYDPEVLARDVGRKKKIKRINDAFHVEILEVPDFDTFEKLYEIASYGLREIDQPDTPTLSGVLKEIDMIMKNEIKWKKFFVSNSVRYGWIIARKTFPKFSAVEKILDGIKEKDLGLILKGMLKLSIGDLVPHILFEIV